MAMQTKDIWYKLPEKRSGPPALIRAADNSTEETEMHGIKGIPDRCAAGPETGTDIPAHTPGQITHRACIPVLYARDTHVFWIRHVHERMQLRMWAQKDRSYIRKGIRYTIAWL